MNGIQRARKLTVCVTKTELGHYEKISEVRRFARKPKLNYRIAMGTKATKALFTAGETLPMTVVIDRKGAVRDVIEGIMYADEFDQKVRPLATK